MPSDGTGEDRPELKDKKRRQANAMESKAKRAKMLRSDLDGPPWWLSVKTAGRVSVVFVAVMGSVWWICTPLWEV